MNISKKWFGMAPLFNPEDGITIIEPLNEGAGWWAGAPSALYDDETDRFYLYYRRRKPRELGRGTDCYIAESKNGINFTTIWEANKSDFNSPSVEKSALVKTLEGKCRLYISYVDPEDNKWRTDMLEADSFDKLEPAKRTKIFTADDVGVEGVKDPYVIIVGRKYYMILSYAPSPKRADELKGKMHATADVYNTGLTKSHTALAVSSDGINYNWLGDVFSPRDKGWDAYAARISTIVYIPPVFNAFYDGSKTVKENYEEKTGLAISFDLRNYERVSDFVNENQFVDETNKVIFSTIKSLLDRNILVSPITLKNYL